MIKVTKKELLAAVDKASVCSKDTYIVSFTDKTNSEGLHFATVLASDGLRQAITTFFAKVEKPVSFVVGSEFVEVLKALGQFGDEYTITLDEKSIEISVGSASTPLPLKEDGTKIMMQNPKKDKTVINVSSDREAFIKAVRQGAFAYGEAGAQNIALTVAIRYVKENDSKKLYFISTDGKMAVRSHVEVVSTEEIELEDGVYICVDAPSLRAICSKLEGEKINVFAFDKQVIIKDGNDYFTIVRYSNKFPKAIDDLLDNVEYNYKADLDVPTLKAGLKVATLLEQSDKKGVIINVNGENVTVSDVLGKSKASVKAEKVEGEIKVAINPRNFELAFSNIGADKVTVYGKSDALPVYIIADNVRFLTTPILIKN